MSSVGFPTVVVVVDITTVPTGLAARRAAGPLHAESDETEHCEDDDYDNQRLHAGTLAPRRGYLHVRETSCHGRPFRP